MEAYILDTVRTPRGKASPKGGLAGVKPIDLLATLYQALQERNRLETAVFSNIILGCVTQTAEQGANLAKISALYAGLGEHIPGLTLNSFCTSGLEAIGYAATRIAAGLDDLVVAGGVESVSRVPMFSDNGPWYNDPEVSQRTGFVHMGIAADLVATMEGFERPLLDAYGVRSHQRAAQAWQNGRFAPSLIPINDFAYDEHIRPDTTLEKLALLEPAFTQVGADGVDVMLLQRYPYLSHIHHLHHRGNSPALADGAGLILLGSKETAAKLGLRPRARVRAIASTSVDPVVMLTAGQTAIEKVLKTAELTVADVDLFEFAEAFAALCLKLQRDLAIPDDKLNVNGGTIAMGHAFGATGAILTATLLDELERRSGNIGVVAISGAAGLGAAMVLERI